MRNTDKPIVAVGLAPIAFLLFAAVAAGQTQFMPVDQVRAGMTGTVRTTLSGTQVEEITAEVIGVIRNAAGPNLHYVLVRLTSERVKSHGVAYGMSGSPFYIDGKLVGALSTRVGLFAVEPIATVTPIEAMLSSSGGGYGAGATIRLDLSRLWRDSEDVQWLSQRMGIELPSCGPTDPGAELAYGIQQVSIPLAHSGLEPETIERFAPLLANAGFELAGAAAMGSGAVVEGELEPGMPITIELIGGDLTIGASGIVTHIDGNKLWGFGHPMFQQGDVDWPLVRATLIFVFPSLQASFYITNSAQTIGSITQDRTAAVFGELGREAKVIPMSVQIKKDGEAVAGYNFRLVRDALLTPVLIDMALSNAVLVSQRQIGEMSLQVSATLKLEGAEDIRIENLYSGFNVAAQAGALPSAAYFFLVNNEFEPVSVSAIEIEVDATDRQNIATLQRAWFTKTEVKPGEQFRLIMELKPRRGRAFTLEQEYAIPATLQRGTYKVIVGSAEAVTRQENELVEGEIKLRNLRQMIRLVNSLRSGSKLYVQVFREEEGVYFEGDFFPSLPPSALSVINANRGDDNFVRLRGTIVDERRMETEYLVRGDKRLQFVVER